MNNNKVTWKSFLEYTKESYSNQMTEWRSWKWYEWIAQVVWLNILVAMLIVFIRTIELVSVNPNPSGLIAVLFSISPLLMITAIFLTNWLYRKLIQSIFSYFKRR